MKQQTSLNKNESRNERQVYFLSFADKRLKKSLSRIKKQAKEMGVFNRIYCWDERNLDKEFWIKWGKFCKTTRGFGYWIFKSQMALQVLEEMQNGDILIYSDVGNHINKYGKNRLLQYFDMLEKSECGGLAFNTTTLEKIWTKGDLFDYFNIRFNTDITDTYQYWAGLFMLKKSATSVNFVKKMRSIYDENINLINDTPSVSPNLEGFIEHRWDQSVFSILCKLNNVPFVPAYETYPAYPFSALRDKKESFLIRIVRKISKILRKVEESV